MGTKISVRALPAKFATAETKINSVSYKLPELVKDVLTPKSSIIDSTRSNGLLPIWEARCAGLEKYLKDEFPEGDQRLDFSAMPLQGKVTYSDFLAWAESVRTLGKEVAKVFGVATNGQAETKNACNMFTEAELAAMAEAVAEAEEALS